MATWELLITRIWLYIVFCEKFLFVFLFFRNKPNPEVAQTENAEHYADSKRGTIIQLSKSGSGK